MVDTTWSVVRGMKVKAYRVAASPYIFIEKYKGPKNDIKREVKDITNKERAFNKTNDKAEDREEITHNTQEGIKNNNNNNSSK